MRFIVGLMFAGALAGCSTPLPLLGVALDGKVDVQIEAKLTKDSGEVVPVADYSFGYQLLDADSAGAKVLDQGTFKTGFDGKSTLRVSPGIVSITGNYSVDGRKVSWQAVRFKVDSSNHEIRLSNSNGRAIFN